MAVAQPGARCRSSFAHLVVVVVAFLMSLGGGPLSSFAMIYEGTTTEAGQVVEVMGDDGYFQLVEGGTVTFDLEYTPIQRIVVLLCTEDEFLELDESYVDGICSRLGRVACHHTLTVTGGNMSFHTEIAFKDDFRLLIMNCNGLETTFSFKAVFLNYYNDHLSFGAIPIRFIDYGVIFLHFLFFNYWWMHTCMKDSIVPIIHWLWMGVPLLFCVAAVVDCVYWTDLSRNGVLNYRLQTLQEVSRLVSNAYLYAIGLQLTTGWGIVRKNVWVLGTLLSFALVFSYLLFSLCSYFISQWFFLTVALSQVFIARVMYFFLNIMKRVNAEANSVFVDLHGYSPLFYRLRHTLIANLQFAFMDYVAAMACVFVVGFLVLRRSLWVTYLLAQLVKVLCVGFVSYSLRRRDVRRDFARLTEDDVGLFPMADNAVGVAPDLPPMALPFGVGGWVLDLPPGPQSSVRLSLLELDNDFPPYYNEYGAGDGGRDDDDDAKKEEEEDTVEAAAAGAPAAAAAAAAAAVVVVAAADHGRKEDNKVDDREGSGGRRSGNMTSGGGSASGRLAIGGQGRGGNTTRAGTLHDGEDDDDAIVVILLPSDRDTFVWNSETNPDTFLPLFAVGAHV